MAREWDIVVFGATGFTGRQCAHYLSDKAPSELKLAIAGRNEAGLKALAQELGRPNVGVILADVTQPDTLIAMAKSTRVLATTVGPYALYGSELLAACVAHQTHYCDITGETPWVRDMIDAHHERALESRTRIVPLCGFDSIPADLGTWALVQHAKQVFGESPRRVKGWYRLRGGLNGGTLASALNLNASGEVKRLARPFLLSPGYRASPEEMEESRDPRQVLRDPHWGWCTPFFMGAVNTRAVRRSAFLLADEAEGYGPGFTYQEYMGSGRGRSRWKASRDVALLGVLLGVMSTGWGRAILRALGPKPGRGPSQKTIETGAFVLDLVAESPSGETIWGAVRGKGDPGNAVTVTCLAESALCLALDEDTLDSKGGVLTPAAAFGEHLLERLAGTCLSIEVGVKAPGSSP